MSLSSGPHQLSELRNYSIIVEVVLTIIHCKYEMIKSLRSSFVVS